MKVPVFQLLTASFTLKIEKGNKIAFLDMPFTMEPDRCLNTSVYRKPTHTDQYLPVAYDSHYPQSVKPGIVTCSYDQAKCLMTKPSIISEEKRHLSSVLFCKGYPSSFVQKVTKTRNSPIASDCHDTNSNRWQSTPSLNED